MSLFTFDDTNEEFLKAFKKQNAKSEPYDMVYVETLPGLHPLDSLTAPRDWNNYLTAGNFKGCRPIVKAGAKINVNAFETINFEMV